MLESISSGRHEESRYRRQFAQRRARESTSAKRQSYLEDPEPNPLNGLAISPSTLRRNGQGSKAK